MREVVAMRASPPGDPRGLQDGHWFPCANAVIDRYGRDLGPHGIALYVALSRFAGGKDHCWPSRRRLMAVTGMGTRKFAETRERLVKLCLIEVRARQAAPGDADSPMYSLLPVAAEVGGGAEVASPPTGGVVPTWPHGEADVVGLRRAEQEPPV